MPAKKIVKQVEKRNTATNAKKKVDKIFMPTGCTLIDLVTCGGYQAGKIINIVGDTSTGKTYLAIECIASAKQKFGKKLKWFYDNSESGFSFDTNVMYGFDVLTEAMQKNRSVTVEDFSVNLHKQLKSLKSDEYLIYVLDSLDGLSSEAERKRDKERIKAAEADKDYDKGTYAMEKQKYLSEFFRLRSAEIEDKNCLLIVISQVRHNIGVMFGEQYKRSGGKALDFYAHICLWLAVVEKIKKKNRMVAVTIKAKTKKAKISKPFRECFFDLIFDYGIDDIGSNIDFLYDLRTCTGNRSIKKEKVEWEGTEYTRDALIKHIEENNLELQLEEKTITKWNDIEKEIATDRKSKWE